MSYFGGINIIPLITPNTAYIIVFKESPILLLAIRWVVILPRRRMFPKRRKHIASRYIIYITNGRLYRSVKTLRCYFILKRKASSTLTAAERTFGFTCSATQQLHYVRLSNYSYLCSGSTSNVLMRWSNVNLGKETFPSTEKTKETQELHWRGSPAFYSCRKSCTTRTDLACCRRNPTDWTSQLPVFVCLFTRCRS
jgi:hypothetical protein